MNRRKFLATAGLATSASLEGGWGQAVQDRGRELQIAAVTPIPVHVPRTEQAGQYWMFVKVSTNKKDLLGYGELYTVGVPFEPATVAAMVRDFGQNIAVGSNPYHIESLFQRGYAYHYTHHPDFVRLGLLSALEMACWDIVGKDLNKPVYDLLGGPVRNRIRTYTYINDNVPPGDREVPLWYDPQASAERAKYYTSLGFNALKLDPVQGASKEISEHEMIYPIEESLEALDRSEKVIGAVRQAVGDKCDVLIGTHGQFTAAGAVAFAKRLEKFSPMWFEEPVPPDNIAEMALVANRTSIPICTGERLTSKYEFANLIEQKAATILNFDLGRVGGILEARKIAAMAEAHYLQIAPHLWGGPILAASCLQLDICCANFLIQESMGTMTGFHAELLRSPIEWKDGFIIPSGKPGLGYELDETVLAKHAFPPP